jgi:hypothetical protein
MNHRDRVLKTLADDVARALADDRGGLQLLRCLGLLSDGADEAVTPAAPRPGWVGIWEPHAENGSTSYRRSPERSAEWASWADVERIPRRGEGKRVVFIGESVARGYFYDPRLTPASVLEGLLQTTSVPGGVEVVDLAKNDLDGLSLGALVSSSLALEPDAIVIYAGNNWAQAPALVKGWPERHLTATVLREQGVPGLKSYLDAKLLELFETRLRGPLAALSARVPIVLVVPEFNLGDWSFAGPADAPWLPGDGNERWVRCYLEAERALRENSLAEAEARAREMIELDGGTAASGFTLLASCRRREGADGELRVLLQKARDARSWDATAQPPRPLTFLQDALRRTGSRDGIRLVDLPKVFEEHLGGLPDRRLFLDYCHLTSDGIRLAMSAVAESLAPVLGGRETARAELFGVPLAVDPEVESEARFAAAIHNAHWGQSGDVVHHHCVEALRACPGIASAMQDFVELQCRRAPAWMCGAGERLARRATAGPLRRYLHVYMVYGRGKFLDAVLLDAVTGALEEAGVPARDRVEELRRSESGLRPGRPEDLLSQYYRSAWTDRDWLWRPNRYHRAHAPVSRFSLVCSSQAAVALRIVCRRPDGAAPAGPCELSVNGESVGELAAGTEWRAWELTLPAQAVREGLNSLELRWPLRTAPGESGLQRAARNIEAGLDYQLLPVFGEIHTLTATVAAE